MPRPRSKPPAGPPDYRAARALNDAMFKELIVYVGLIATRKEAQDDAHERIGHIGYASAFGFGPNVTVAAPEQVAALPRRSDLRRYESASLTLADLRMTPDGLRPRGGK